MPAFPSSQSPNAYDKFRFGLSLESRTVAGFSTISKLPSQTGGLPCAPLEAAQADIVTLGHGMTRDASFARWLLSAPGQAPSHNLVLTLRDLHGTPSNALVFKACQVVMLAALPDLDAATNALLIQRLELRFEGWRTLEEGAR